MQIILLLLLTLGFVSIFSHAGWKLTPKLQRIMGTGPIATVLAILGYSLILGAVSFAAVDYLLIQAVVADEIARGERTMEAGIYQTLLGTCLLLLAPFGATLGSILRIRNRHV